MFQDVVDDLGQRLENVAGDLKDVFAKLAFVFTLETTYEQFEETLKRAKEDELEIPRMEDGESPWVFELVSCSAF